MNNGGAAAAWSRFVCLLLPTGNPYKQSYTLNWYFTDISGVQGLKGFCTPIFPLLLNSPVEMLFVTKENRVSKMHQFGVLMNL